ncbi:MAG: YkgJ family cysteine cluster protein [Nitrosarchaeum sp.]|nr:YkgJ family cysteine cluster protein [Nitrosarchaeum sp.]
MDECGAYCCRKGFLTMTSREAVKVCQGKSVQFVEEGRIKVLGDGRLSLSLEGGCPSLKEDRCTIHSSALRPKTCGDFPLYLHGDTVFASPRCLAVRRGTLYPYLRRFALMGLKVVTQSPFGTLEMRGFEGFEKRQDAPPSPAARAYEGT